MKALWQWIPGILFSGLATLPLLAIEVGDPIESVQAELGEPTGTMSLGDRTFLMYPRGMITFCDGLVSAVELESAEAFAQRQRAEADRLAEEEAFRILQAAEQQAEGEALKEKILASADYQAASASDRVKLWQKFRKKYPSVDVAEWYLADLKEYEREVVFEQRIREQEQRIAQLEQRVQQAERQQRQTRIRIEEPARVYYPVPYIIHNGQRIRRTTPVVNCPTPQPNRSVQITTPSTSGGSTTVTRRGNSLSISGGGFSLVQDSGQTTRRSVSLIRP